MFAVEFVPSTRRTYRGLVLEDKKELGELQGINVQNVSWWREDVAAEIASRHAAESGRGRIPTEISVPTFFLSVLDLHKHPTFGDSDIPKIRTSMGPILAFLSLSGTKVTDEGISSLARARTMQGEHNYERLEVLLLRGLRHVTDLSAPKLGKFQSLRMLGESPYPFSKR